MSYLHVKSNPDLRLSPAVALEVKFAPGGAGEIEGYASAFDGPPDAYGDLISKGAFRRTLAEHRSGGTMPAMLWAHDLGRVVGRWLDMAEDDFGLRVRGQINLATTEGKNAYEHVKSGDVGAFSIGFLIPEGGSTVRGRARVITDLELVEVSLVAMGANRRARVAGVKSLAAKSDLIDLLRDGGLSKAAAARIAAGGWAALSGADHQKAIDLAADVARATQSLKEYRK